MKAYFLPEILEFLMVKWLTYNDSAVAKLEKHSYYFLANSTTARVKHNSTIKKNVKSVFANLDEVEAPEVVVPDTIMVEFPDGGGGKTNFGCFWNFGGGGLGGDIGLA